MLKDIVLDNLANRQDLFRLKEYLRELYGFIDRISTASVFSATPAFDANLSGTYYMLLTNNVTAISFLNAAIGRRIRLIFQQDGTGGRTVAGWAADILLAGGALTVTSTANKHSTVEFEYAASGKWIETNRSLNV